MGIVGRDYGQFPALQVNHLLGVLQNGRDVGGNKHLAVTHAHSHTARVAQTSRHQLVRFRVLITTMAWAPSIFSRVPDCGFQAGTLA